MPLLRRPAARSSSVPTVPTAEGMAIDDAAAGAAPAAAEGELPGDPCEEGPPLACEGWTAARGSGAPLTLPGPREAAVRVDPRPPTTQTASHLHSPFPWV